MFLLYCYRVDWVLMRYTDAGTAATRCFSSWYDLEYKLLQLVFLFNSLLFLFGIGLL